MLLPHFVRCQLLVGDYDLWTVWGKQVTALNFSCFLYELLITMESCHFKNKICQNPDQLTCSISRAVCSALSSISRVLSFGSGVLYKERRAKITTQNKGKKLFSKNTLIFIVIKFVIGVEYQGAKLRLTSRQCDQKDKGPMFVLLWKPRT